MWGIMSLLHVLLRMIIAYLVFGICISMPHFSSLLASFCLLCWWHMWHIDNDVLGIVFGVRTIIFHDSSDVPHNTKECCTCLRNFVFWDQLASLYAWKHVYHRRCIARTLPRAPTYPICRGVILNGDGWLRHPDDATRMLNISFFFFFSFFCVLQFSL